MGEPQASNDKASHSVSTKTKSHSCKLPSYCYACDILTHSGISSPILTAIQLSMNLMLAMKCLFELTRDGPQRLILNSQNKDLALSV